MKYILTLAIALAFQINVHAGTLVAQSSEIVGSAEFVAYAEGGLGVVNDVYFCGMRPISAVQIHWSGDVTNASSDEYGCFKQTIFFRRGQNPSTTFEVWVDAGVHSKNQKIEIELIGQKPSSGCEGGQCGRP